jgi:hypothetical protein
MRYEIVREIPDDWGAVVIQRHPEQPEDGFGSAVEASLWCDAAPRSLGGEWYIRPVAS